MLNQNITIHTKSKQTIYIKIANKHVCHINSAIDLPFNHATRKYEKSFSLLKRDMCIHTATLTPYFMHNVHVFNIILWIIIVEKH